MALFNNKTKQTIDYLKRANSALYSQYTDLRAYLESQNTTDVSVDVLSNFKWTDPNRLNYSDFYQIYKNNPVSGAIIDILTRQTWKKRPRLNTEQEASRDVINTLLKTLKAYPVLEDADRDALLGEFSVVVLGLPGNTEEPIERSSVIAWVQSYSQAQATITEYYTDEDDPNFGKPKYYSITGRMGEKTVIKKYHASRCIHLSRSTKVKTTPYLTSLFNTTKDVLKTAGSGSEAVFRAACYILTAQANSDSPLLETADSYDALEKVGRKDQPLVTTLISSMKSALQRGFGVVFGQGVDFKKIQSSPIATKDPFDTGLSILALKSGIPKRILMGNEAGELASTQDRNTLNDTIQTRQENYIVPKLLNEFVQKLIDIRFIRPFDYSWEFDVLTEPTEKEKAEATKAKSETLRNIVQMIALGADEEMVQANFPEFFGDTDNE